MGLNVYFREKVVDLFSCTIDPPHHGILLLSIIKNMSSHMSDDVNEWGSVCVVQSLR